jgi:hypothetical protein
MATDTQSLLASANAYASVSRVTGATLLKLALLQLIANNVAPSVNTDPQSLLSSANVSSYAASSPADIATLLELALLQIIAGGISGVSSGGAATFGNYAGGQPNFTPTSGTGLAVDTSNGTLWEYYGGAWH